MSAIRISQSEICNGRICSNEFLLRTPIGERVTDMLQAAELFAPALLDVEVMAVLRKQVLGRELETKRALLALEDLASWDVERIEHRQLWREAWLSRNNVSAYDAFYVATARIFDATILTIDGPLSRAPLRGVAVQNVRLH